MGNCKSVLRSRCFFVQPFDHAKLPLNVLAGWIVFSWVPPGRLWLGAAIIIASGCFYYHWGNKKTIEIEERKFKASEINNIHPFYIDKNFKRVVTMKKPVELHYTVGRAAGVHLKSIAHVECTLTKDILKDTFENELADVDVRTGSEDWLLLVVGTLKLEFLACADSCRWRARLLAKAEALNRGVLVQSVIKEWTKRDSLKGNIVLRESDIPILRQSKENAWWSGCWVPIPRCRERQRRSISYDSRSKRTLVKKHQSPSTQIRLDGKYALAEQTT